MLLAVTSSTGEPVAYANLAVRSRKVRDVIDVQLPQAAALGADLVSVLIGANDLVGRRADPEALARDLGAAVSRLRSTGCDVLLVTPFLPRRPATRFFTRRFHVYNAKLRELAEATGSMLLDVDLRPELVDDERWAEDRVHLNAAGHRGIAYAAARVLGVQDASVLGELERAVHEQEDEPGRTAVGDAEWLLRHAVPWLRRRLAGRAAGDGRAPKRAQLMPVIVLASDRRPEPSPVAAAPGATLEE
jgi:phosphatidylinositol alpha 1,6-mannosyltransferase